MFIILNVKFLNLIHIILTYILKACNKIKINLNLSDLFLCYKSLKTFLYENSVIQEFVTSGLMTHLN